MCPSAQPLRPDQIELIGRHQRRVVDVLSDRAVTTALSAKVAGAAVETLIGLDDPSATNQLQLLSREIRRRDLVSGYMPRSARIRRCLAQVAEPPNP
jgi:hypothetical protein